MQGRVVLADHADGRVEQVRRPDVPPVEVEDRPVAQRAAAAPRVAPDRPHGDLRRRPGVLLHVVQRVPHLADAVPAGVGVGDRHGLRSADEVGVRRHVGRDLRRTSSVRMAHLEEQRPSRHGHDQAGVRRQLGGVEAFLAHGHSHGATGSSCRQ